ncbi:hypothetical protein DPMN_130086 [Dreissena polymorpha]|uniref:Uncharacterized protein n=1 Tax=Dreissena polymorpha TaxID=45954 RepID=A0A9D4H729_DREPO|nr:hypothetical protein DPMN_130086 [Dreissena polymorpha]
MHEVLSAAHHIPDWRRISVSSSFIYPLCPTAKQVKGLMMMRKRKKEYSTDLAVNIYNNMASVIIGSPVPSRFANAGRSARTGMIRSKPVNSPAESRAPVKAGSSPVRPGRAPVYRNTTGTHRVYTGIRPRQSYGNAPVSPRSSPVMPRRSPGECRDSELGLGFFEELRQTLGIGDPGLTVKVINYKNVLETIAFKYHFMMHKVESRASYNIYVVAALNT